MSNFEETYLERRNEEPVTPTPAPMVGKAPHARISLSDPGKNSDCVFFVLDLAHDPTAAVAVNAYADAIHEEHPKLAANLRRHAAQYWT